jgi:4-diphosphocytidyl-2-C-methyl-D-erythritol kinase
MNLHAYAKINIGLRIIGKRPDGYHDLETLFYEIGWSDELCIEPAEQLTMTSNDPDAPADDSNLCMRAARALQQASGIRNGASIHLKKNIPIGAGLGGGSADAAAVLRGLSELWNLHYTSEQLRPIAAALGSDIPFFLDGGCAYGTGRGEILTPVHLALPYWILTVVPAIHVSTPFAYKNLKQHSGAFVGGIDRFVSEHPSDPRSWRGILCNDFEPSVGEAYPVIGGIRQQLDDAGSLFSLMSGSGSSVFGLFESEQIADHARQQFDAPFRTHITSPDFSARRISA